MKENVKSALLAIIGMGSFLVVIVMAVCLYMAFSLSRSLFTFASVSPAFT